MSECRPRAAVRSASTSTRPRSRPSPTAPPSPPAAPRPASRRPTLLTWGLLGPGKGIERVIDAMPSLHDLRAAAALPRGRPARTPRCSRPTARPIATPASSRRGATASPARSSFDADYRDVPSLTALIQSSAAVVLPVRLDATRSTSGVLVDAIAAGRPVIATAFPHAVELLASGAGIVVDHDDPDALALRPAPGAHRAGPRRRHGGGGGPARARAWAGRSSPAPTSTWPSASSPSARRSYDHASRRRFDHLVSHDRRAGHLRARPARRAPARARLLHRRHGPGPRRRRTRSRDRRPPSGGSPSSSLRFLRDAQGVDGGYRNRMDRTGPVAGPPRRRGLLGPEHLGRSAPPRRTATPTGCARSATAQLRAGGPAAVALAAGDGLRRARAPPSCSPSAPTTGRRARS